MNGTLFFQVAAIFYALALWGWKVGLFVFFAAFFLEGLALDNARDIKGGR